jgi:ribonuclease HII
MPNPPPTLVLETQLWQQGMLRVAGVDEVGRGSLCGPVVAAAVLLPAHCHPIAGVKDSKKLSLRQRLTLDSQIRQQAVAIAIGAASVAEIEEHNILQATYLAMQRALARIGPYDHALIDGRAPKKVNLGPMTAVIDGDAIAYSIACASIVAKVRRDRLLGQLAKRHPGYGWETNAGYGTAQHLKAIQDLGLTPHHRRQFAPIRQLSLLDLGG